MCFPQASRTTSDRLQNQIFGAHTRTIQARHMVRGCSDLGFQALGFTGTRITACRNTKLSSIGYRAMLTLDSKADTAFNNSLSPHRLTIMFQGSLLLEFPPQQMGSGVVWAPHNCKGFVLRV